MIYFSSGVRRRSKAMYRRFPFNAGTESLARTNHILNVYQGSVARPVTAISPCRSSLVLGSLVASLFQVVAEVDKSTFISIGYLLPQARYEAVVKPPPPSLAVTPYLH